MTVLQFLGKDSYKISARKMSRLTKNRLDHPQMLIDGILVDRADATY